jgi:hypothetical protein
MNYPFKQPDNRQLSKENITANNETDGRGKNPKSLANLKPFPKGVSGNPSGRPTRIQKLGDALKKFAHEKGVISKWDPDCDSWIESTSLYTWQDDVLIAIWKKARGGDMQAISILADGGCLEKNT